MRFLLFFFLLPLCSAAQPQMEWYYHPGSVEMNDGTIKNGIIRVYGTANEPWHYQSSIRFIDSTTWMGLTKVKKKDFTVYGPDDIKSYRLHDVSLTFVSKPYADMTSVSLKMIKKQYFMYAISLGKVNLLHYYDAPPNFYVGSDGEYEKMKQEAAMNNYVLLEKDPGKLKNITDIDLRALISDCPEVLAKYESGAYGPAPKDDGKKKGLGKFVSRVIDSNRMKEFAEPLFKDYNSTCK
jgi:hypothetical protein